MEKTKMQSISENLDLKTASTSELVEKEIKHSFDDTQHIECIPLLDESQKSVIDFFEGPEKLLEVWFVRPNELKSTPSETLDIKKGGLRSLPIKNWEEMLKLVNCTILSVTSNDYLDAYVLSESSLFVWEQKIILKTCGTTTLLRALPMILQLGRDCGFTILGDVFYSRRNFFSQPKQLAPHSSFSDEVQCLDNIFDGSAYVLGKTNGDHWYLYLTDNNELIENRLLERGPLRSLNVLKTTVASDPDFTLEILMTKLDTKIMDQFFKKDKTAREITELSGIGGLFPGAIIDDYLFDPQGYSMNGLLGEGYFTIHITPQPSCSYVSFETNINVSGNDYSSLVEKVLNVFKPGNFTVTLFGGHVENFSSISKKLFQSQLLGTGTQCLSDSRRVYLRRTQSHYTFENYYELVFAHYERVNTKEFGKTIGCKRKTYLQ